MIKYIFLLCILFSASPVFATAQEPDYIEIDGEAYSLNTNPLEQYFNQSPENRPGGEQDPLASRMEKVTSNYRMYTAHFKVSSNSLSLSNLTVYLRSEGPGDDEQLPPAIDRYVPDENVRQMEWYSGVLVIPNGQMIHYEHLAYASIYESYILLRVENGKITDRADMSWDEFLDYKGMQYDAYMKTSEFTEELERLSPTPDLQEAVKRFIYDMGQFVETMMLDFKIVALTEAKIGKRLQSWVDEQGFNGVINVNYANHVDVTKVAGIADNDTGRLLTEDSVFQTGSVDKLFASAAVFALIDEGVLDLQAPISRYLPDYRADTGEQVTLAYLLTNRSGIPDDYRQAMPILMQALMSNSPLPDELSDMELGVKAYGSGDLKFTPGEQFDYVFVNWVLLRLILEKVTDRSYHEVLQQYVFEPAGMNQSGTFVMDLTQSNPEQEDIAIGYDADDEQFKSDFPLPAFVGGGSYTTAKDLTAFFHSLYWYIGKLMSSETLEEFSAVKTPDEDYAYGGRVASFDDRPGKRYSWQSGSNGATNIVGVYEMNSGYSFVAMSNFSHDMQAMFDLALEIEKIFD